MKKHSNLNQNSGFTLVELAVVLTIIAFIIAGIIGGKSMIRSAKLNSVTSDVQSFRAAVDNFFQIYLALPGDMPNALTYWTVAIGGGCEGDGNSQINAGVGGTTCAGALAGTAYAAANTNENILAWRHLGFARILPYTLNGLATAATENFVVGTNIPASQVDRAGFSLNFSPAAPAGRNRNEIIFAVPTGGATHDSAALTPFEAEAIDEKLDDRIANAGNIVASDDPVLAALATPITCSAAANYNVATTTNACVLNFWLGR